jgi:hypothetical protein
MTVEQIMEILSLIFYPNIMTQMQYFDYLELNLQTTEYVFNEAL